MNELNKTICFFIAAVAVVALAVFTRPSADDTNVDELRGTQLVEEFSLDAPKRLRIQSVSESTGELRSFEVAEVDGVWTIPSKSGYPADATQQMAAAVEGVVGREVLAAIDASPGDHALYGVLDPTDTTTTSDTGFGTRVRLSDKDDKVLADLIIGNEVKDRPGQYYVRKATQDVVYQVEIDLDKFSTDFADWIEKDLLGLSTFDVAEVLIDDYTIETEVVLTNRGLEESIQEDRRARMHLRYDDQESQWQPVSLEQFDEQSGSYAPFTLSEQEQLNEDALRELKNALDDLVIVDVERKPEGLSGDLKAGSEFINSREAVISLAERGFIPTRDPRNPQAGIVLLSSEGEVVVTLNNGVEYVLRFGDLQLDNAEEAPPANAEVTEEEAEGDQLNRYLFVMARFNESAVEKPELEPLPELPADDADQPSDDPETETSDAPADEDSPESGADGEAADGEAADEAAAEDDSPTPEDLQAERERIEQNNQRAQEAYEERLEAGRERVDELNARFGDWYYVIPNEVFKKVHLSREQVVVAKAEEQDQADQAGEAAGPNFGAPGTAIPGLPDLGSPAEPEDESAPAPAESEEPAESDEPAESSESDASDESSEPDAPAEPAEEEEAAADAQPPAEAEPAAPEQPAEGETQPDDAD